MRKFGTALAGIMLAAVVLPVAPASAEDTTTDPCATYVNRLNVLSASWEDEARAADAWEHRAEVLTWSLTVSESRGDWLESELAASETRVERLREKVQALRERLSDERAR